jgi:hypothetical protein
MRGKGRRRTWLIATGGVVTAFVAYVALASAALSEHSKSVTIAAETDGSATAPCPSGTEAVSGGFAAPGFDPQFVGASIIPFGSRRTGNDDWTIDAKNFSQGATSGKLSSYVYCDRHEPGLVKATKTTSIASQTNGSAAAECPRGTEAFSGGWQSPKNVTGDNAFFAFTSKRAGDRKWKVTAFNDDDNNAHDLKVFAFCDKRQPGLVERSKSTTVASGVKTSLKPKCPKSKQAVSGGFQSATVNTEFDAAFAFASRRTSTSTWKTSAYGNGNAGTDSPITGFAYCKK